MDTELGSHLRLLVWRAAPVVVVTMWKCPMTPSVRSTAAPPSLLPSSAQAPPWWSGSALIAAKVGLGLVQFGLKPRKPHIALVDGMNLKGAATNSSLPPLTGTQPMLAVFPTVVASPPYTPRRKMSFLTTCPKGTPI